MERVDADLLAMFRLLGGEAKERIYVHGLPPGALDAIYQPYAITEEQYARNRLYCSRLPEDETLYDDLSPLLPQTRQPLLLQGRYDPACDEAQADLFRRLAPDCRLVLFEHSAHFPRLEEPEKYTQAVLEFVRK